MPFQGQWFPRGWVSCDSGGGIGSPWLGVHSAFFDPKRVKPQRAVAGWVFPSVPWRGRGCSSVPGLPVNLAFQNCLCLTQNKCELCMSGRISSPCHTQCCPGYLWKSRQWHPSCRRKQTLSESPGLLWLFFRPTQSPVGLRKSAQALPKQRGSLVSWEGLTLAAYHLSQKRQRPRAHLSRTWERPGSGSRAPAAASKELLQDVPPPRFLGSPASPGSSAASDTPSSAVSISLTLGSLQTPLQSSHKVASYGCCFIYAAP